MTDFDAPGYWMNEASDVLRPAVEAYLHNEPMSEAQIGAMRAYLRQWIASPAWKGPRIDDLRRWIDKIATRKDIKIWLDAALADGIDPL